MVSRDKQLVTLLVGDGDVVPLFPVGFQGLDAFKAADTMVDVDHIVARLELCIAAQALGIFQGLDPLLRPLVLVKKLPFRQIDQVAVRQDKAAGIAADNQLGPAFF